MCKIGLFFCEFLAKFYQDIAEDLRASHSHAKEEGDCDLFEALRVRQLETPAFAL
jgi:hypothetical protein